MNLVGLFSEKADDRFSSELSRNSSLDSNKAKRKYTQKTKSLEVKKTKAKQKRMTKIDEPTIAHAFRKGCCNDCCLTGYCMDDAEKARLWYHSDGGNARPESDKSEILREIISGGVSSTMSSIAAGVGSRSKMLFFIDGTTVEKVCAVAMMKLLGCSRTKWNEVKQQLASPASGTKRSRDMMNGGYGVDSITSRNTFLSVKEEKIFKFLKSVKKTFAECLPNSQNFDLPSNFTPLELLRMFEQETGLRCTMSYFGKIWKVALFPLCFF